ncbi:hypothetical protein VTO42DRAFT_2791 [Malbranchea cinnamomea]
MDTSALESSGLLGQVADIGLDEATKPAVVGLYGVPGCGKTSLVNSLRDHLGQDEFTFYSVSGVINEIVPDGLVAFRTMPEDEKKHWRERAFRKSQLDCTGSGKTAVVAGYYMLWPEGEDEVETRLESKSKVRAKMKIAYLRKWQDTEMRQLRELCRIHGILFSTLSKLWMADPDWECVVKKAATFLRDFRNYTPRCNMSVATRKLDAAIAAIPGPLNTMLVMDGDKTLAAEDTGVMFWRCCWKIKLYPEVQTLLQHLSNQTYVGAVVVTFGLKCVWVKVLERAGLADRTYVWAFGGRSVDLEMLKKADQAIVMVNDEQTRDDSMDEALRDAIETGGIRARQALLPSAPPRLDVTTLSLVQITDPGFINSVFSGLPRRLFHATDKAAAKLLTIPTHDGEVVATEFLAEIVGLEKWALHPAPGQVATGYQLLHEKNTLIVTLKHGGEPMATGVIEALPQAIRNIVLVDSVVNTGRSVFEFVELIRILDKAIPIVVMSDVIHKRAISGQGLLRALVVSDPNIYLVTLRLSDHEFSKGGTTTDPGLLLSGTTHPQ